MHEISIAYEVINLAEREAKRNKVLNIKEITIEVGDLSGIEADAFGSALNLIIKDSILEQAAITIVRSPGKGLCNGCNYEFEMNHRMATCPKCGCFPSVIHGGDDFRVVSLIVE